MNDNDANAFPKIEIANVVLDCTDIEALSEFYIRMLGWRKDYAEDGQWLSICSPSGGVGIGFQNNPSYIPPTWPEEPNSQQQMLHIDFAVQGEEELARAVQHAISCGAAKAAMQYSDEWVVMIDPAGHPFCFVVR